MYRRILLACDPEGLATVVEPAVVALSAMSGATVRVVSVERVGERSVVPGLAAARAEMMAEHLRRNGVAALGEVRPIRGGSVADELASAARETHADLIALGTHRRGDLAGMLVGSVGHELARKVDIPLLLLGVPSRSETPTLRRVLVAVDTSERTPSTLASATRVLELGGRALVVHVLPGPVTSPTGFGGGEIETEGEAWTLLRNACAELERTGRPTEMRLLSGGLPVADQLAAVAEDWGADVIVLGSRRPSDIGGVVLGSVAHRLVRLSHQPVLLAEHPRPAGTRSIARA